MSIFYLWKGPVLALRCGVIHLKILFCQVQEKLLLFLLESKVTFQFHVFKVDGKHKNADSTFDRLQVDIQHLDLRELAS